MRIELEFDLKKPNIDVDYRRIVLSWIKSCLSICNEGKYLEKYFHGTVPKDYSFTVVFKSPKFTKEKIYLEEPKIKVLFSADDKNKTGFIFFAAFLSMKNKAFPLSDKNTMTLKSVRQKNETIITNSTVFFQTCLGNGLCIRDHNRETNRDRFIVYNDKDFKEKALTILKVQAKLAGYSDKILEDLDIEPVQCKKVLVYHYNIYVDTSVGIFKMQGNPDVLQYLYKIGLGSKHSAGFGMVNVLKQGEKE